MIAAAAATARLRTTSVSAGAVFAGASASGDITNGLDDSLIYAHPSIKTDAEEKSPGVLDDRYTSKIKTVTPKTLQDVTSDLAFTIYDKPDTPVPIIRNEELILLRAEANIGLNNIGTATTDINYIRRRSGGLPDKTGLTAGNILDELLKQKRYSLLFEGGHRWIDLRRYGTMIPVITGYLRGVGGGREDTRRAYKVAAELPTARHRWYPIPNNQIDLSKKGGVSPLTQNTGW